MVPGHPPCALCSLIFRRLILRPIEIFLPNPFGLLQLVFPESFLRCAVVKVRFQRTLKTIQSATRLGFNSLDAALIFVSAYHALRVFLLTEAFASYRPGMNRSISASVSP